MHLDPSCPTATELSVIPTTTDHSALICVSRGTTSSGTTHVEKMEPNRVWMAGEASFVIKVNSETILYLRSIQRSSIVFG